MMTKRRILIAYRINDQPIVTNSPALISAWRLRLFAMRRGHCPRCHANARFLDRSQRAAYAKIHRPAPVLLTHHPRCPASDLAIRDMIESGWN